MVIKRFLLFVLIGLLFMGCGEKWGGVGVPENSVLPVESVFNPLKGELPFPNDFLKGNNGQIVIPSLDSVPVFSSQIVKQLTSMDGFSTLPYIYFLFNGAIDARSVNADSIKLFRIDGEKLIPVKGFHANLDPTTNKKITIWFDLPLRPSSTYLAVLTDNLKGFEGRRVVGSQVFNVLKSKNPLVSDGTSMIVFMTDQQATQLNNVWKVYSKYFSMLERDAHLSREHIVNMTAFTTQSMNTDLDALVEKIKAAQPVFARIRGSSNKINILTVSEFIKEYPQFNNVVLTGVQGIIEGTIKTQDFRRSWTDNDPNAGGINNRGRPTSIRFVLFVPSERQKFQNMVLRCRPPYPVTLMIHPLGMDRLAGVAIANHVMASCHALLSFDLPDHGDRAVRDIDNNGIATSGESYIDPLHLTATRANLEQSVLDMVSATMAVGQYDMDVFPLDHPDKKIDLSGKVDSFLGLGIPGGLGLVYARYNKNLKSMVLNAPGGYWARMVQRSPVFGQRIRLLIAQALNTEPSSSLFNDTFEWYLPMIQWGLNSMDPLNYAKQLDSKIGVLYQSIIGDDVVGNGLNNQHPFESNEVIAYAMGILPPGLTSTITQFDNGIVRGAVRFKKSYATHYILTKVAIVSDSLMETGFFEMANQIWSILHANGSQIEILDPEVVEP